MMKTLQKRVFRQVEHLRLLHMPLFAFLKQFSKIDDENTSKTRFFAMFNTCDYCICLYLRFKSKFQKLMMKTVLKRVFRLVEHLRILLMPLFAFLKQFSKIGDEHTAKKRFFGMLNPCDYSICLYSRF